DRGRPGLHAFARRALVRDARSGPARAGKGIRGAGASRAGGHRRPPARKVSTAVSSLAQTAFHEGGARARRLRIDSCALARQFSVSYFFFEAGALLSAARLEEFFIAHGVIRG